MSKNNKKNRPPVVVIVGHVDHGKTSILDYIRKAKVAEKESGGITQHIGAYQIEQSGKKITFIDTPGHEAFTAMRSRGVQVADIAILVVAADDGVMPQTKEAISIIQKSGLPFVVAINKIDTPGADVQKVKNQLTENSVLLEGYGGQVPNVEISAKTGQGIDDLLDIINLVAELEELTYSKEEDLEAVVIESAMDTQRGAVGTLLINKGVLKMGSIIAGSSTWAKVRGMEDFLGEGIEKADPSTPVFVLGFQGVPGVGEKFIHAEDQKAAENRIAKKERKDKEGHLLAVEEGQQVVNMVLRADAEGTLEAIHEVLRSIRSEEFKLRVLSEGVGDITDSDVRLAANGNGFVAGFRVKQSAPAKNISELQEVPVAVFNTIYDLVEGVRELISEHLTTEVTEEIAGKFKVLKIFRTEPSRMIVGGKITEGRLRRGLPLRVVRDGEVLGKGKLNQLKSVDKAIEEATKPDEVGVLFDGNIKLQEGDVLEAIEKKEAKPQI
ncbi:MAG: translation initiation factor IF-2 [Candidatus Spechtbacterales bacterium]|nr:translation initiation factor IF-2 [Candidatus Spechtbacterales bacterium]